MLPSWASDVVTVVRAPVVVDRYNNEVRDWDNATRATVGGCSVQPLDSSGGLAITPGRDAVVTRWRLFAPDGVDLLPTDRIGWQGVDYEVDGDLERWSSPSGGLAHAEVLLRRVEG